MDKRQTASANKMQQIINGINTKLHGVNLKLLLKVEQISMRWYEYTIFSIQNDSNGNIVEHKVISGKPEIIFGYLNGFNDAIYLFDCSVQQKAHKKLLNT